MNTSVLRPSCIRAKSASERPPGVRKAAIPHGVRRHDVEPGRDPAVRHGDVRGLRRRDGGRHPGDDLARNPPRHKVLHLLASAPEHERIAALEPHDPVVLQRLAEEQRVYLGLLQRVVAALLADVDEVAAGLRLLEEVFGGKSVVDDRVRLPNRGKSPYRYQPGVARPRPHERNCAGRPLRKPKIVNCRPVHGGNGDTPVNDGRENADRAMAVGPRRLEECAFRRGHRLRVVVAKRVDHGAQPLVSLAELYRELSLVRRGDHPFRIEVLRDHVLKPQSPEPRGGEDDRVEWRFARLGGEQLPKTRVDVASDALDAQVGAPAQEKRRAPGAPRRHDRPAGKRVDGAKPGAAHKRVARVLASPGLGKYKPRGAVRRQVLHAVDGYVHSPVLQRALQLVRERGAAADL